MVTPLTGPVLGGAEGIHLPIPGGDESGAKWLIGAVLAAGQDGCQCTACQLLKKFGAKLSKALSEEKADAGS